MTGWATKRFWKAASVVPVDGGFAVHLDDRPLRTPAKAALIVPTRALACAITAEWDAQTGKIDPRKMPVTGSANAAIDKVAPQHAEVAGLIAAYGATDLLCYRAASPVELVARQADEWDPVLDWAAQTLGAPLHVTVGVIHVDQPEASLAALTARVLAMDAFELTALSDLVALSGSLVIGLAVADSALAPDRAWHISRCDERFQAEIWGEDEDAARAQAAKAADFGHAHRFRTLLTQGR